MVQTQHLWGWELLLLQVPWSLIPPHPLQLPLTHRSTAISWWPQGVGWRVPTLLLSWLPKLMTVLRLPTDLTLCKKESQLQSKKTDFSQEKSRKSQKKVKKIDFFLTFLDWNPFFLTVTDFLFYRVSRVAFLPPQWTGVPFELGWSHRSSQTQHNAAAFGSKTPSNNPHLSSFHMNTHYFECLMCLRRPLWEGATPTTVVFP